MVDVGLWQTKGVWHRLDGNLLMANTMYYATGFRTELFSSGSDSLRQPLMCFSSHCAVKEPLETPFGETLKLSFLSPRTFICSNLSLIQLRIWSCVQRIFTFMYQLLPKYSVNFLLNSFSCNETLIVVIIVSTLNVQKISAKCRILFAFNISNELCALLFNCSIPFPVRSVKNP